MTPGQLYWSVMAIIGAVIVAQVLCIMADACKNKKQQTPRRSHDDEYGSGTKRRL